MHLNSTVQQHNNTNSTVLYSAALYCAVQYSTVLCVCRCAILYCTLHVLLSSTVLYSNVQYSTVLFRTWLSRAAGVTGSIFTGAPALRLQMSVSCCASVRVQEGVHFRGQAQAEVHAAALPDRVGACRNPQRREGTVLYSVEQYSVLHRTVQCSAVQCSAVKYSTLQYSLLQ